jgi:hypothetical protein
MSHHTPFVTARGHLSTLSEANRARLSAYLMQGSNLLGTTPLGAHGGFQFHLARHLAHESDISVVLAPKNLDAQSLASRAELPRTGIAQSKSLESGAIDVEFHGVNDALIDPWWRWCRDYTISGTLETAAGCPIPAQVTIYNVTTESTGLVKTPIVTVPTDANGNFSACFTWCSYLCWWPCRPIWWRCWPWWWEHDILTVIGTIENTLRARSATAARAPLQAMAPLSQPDGAALMTGQGFAAGRTEAAQLPDPARTRLIETKFANPALRELFPWWWWCCENPNIVFSAMQGSVTILDEDPSISTRWCFGSGQSVALTGNASSVGACTVQPQSGPNTFAWISVGDEPGGISVADISMGYANGAVGTPASNMAFAGQLNLTGGFAGAGFAYYQVLAAPYLGANLPGAPATGPNPARSSAAAPGVYAPQSATLTDSVTIVRAATGMPDPHGPYPVVLGPFTYNGIENLYLTRAQAQVPASVPAAVSAQIGAFPALNPGDVVFWSAPNLVLSVPAASLVGAGLTGGVSLTIAPYDINANPLPTPPFELGPPLDLMIDATGLAAASVDWSLSGIFNADGSVATETTPSGSSCPAYQITTPSGGYVLLHVTVTDTPGLLYEYHVETQYGHGTTIAPTPVDRDYAEAPSSFSAPSAGQLYGVDALYQPPNALPNPPPASPAPAYNAWSFVGGGDKIYIPITQSCCYDFQLIVGKRVTNGQFYPPDTLGTADFQTVNITVAAS